MKARLWTALAGLVDIVSPRLASRLYDRAAVAWFHNQGLPLTAEDK